VPSTEPDDTTLVARLVDGDQAALAVIYQRHVGAVLGLSRQVLADATQAEEVAQTVFLRLWEQPHRFDAARGALRSYLLTMAHTRSIDLLRSEQARRRREERDHHRGEPLATPEEIGGWLQTARAEVREALLQLPEQERRALVAAYYGGYTYKQVAELLGQPEGTVKSRIRVGLDRLRGLLTTEEGRSTGGEGDGS
jgi:RNA polymerase sigma-70 factor (ECF subfamily)